MTFRKIFVYIAALVWTLPLIASAQTTGAGIQNPLNASYSTIPTFIAGFLKVMVQIGLPIVALFLLLSGFQFIKARGNPEKLNDAKNNFVYVIIGASLILGAWVLATLIGNTVSQVVGTGLGG
jgi:hypothetical protein